MGGATNRKKLSKLPEKEDDQVNKFNKNKFQGFSQTMTNSLYSSEKSEMQSLGQRTQISFNKQLQQQLPIQSVNEIFKNINEKLKDLDTFVETLKLESHEIDLMGLIQDQYEKLQDSNSMSDYNCEQKVHVKRYKDAIYVGEINSEFKRQGQGIMLYINGRRYEGQWENDLRSRRGYERHSNGNIYQGEFKDGKANGHGIQIWMNGEKYDGQWEMGMRSGMGIWTGTENGNTYMGKWCRNKAEGYGTYTWPNGDTYEGEWQASQKHGKGTDFFSNGDKYNGFYKEGKPHGQGIYTWINGSSYVGEFSEGLKNGKGIWKKDKDDITGHRYEGNYQNDRKHGYGEFYWQSGNAYKGNYQNDERDGFGEMFFSDGTVYKGDWTRGLQNGRGTIINPDGTQIEGYFVNNVYYGQNSPISSQTSGAFNFKTSLQKKANMIENSNMMSDLENNEIVSPFMSPSLPLKANQQNIVDNERRTSKHTRVPSRDRDYNHSRGNLISDPEDFESRTQTILKKTPSDAQLPKILARNATQTRLQSSQVLVNKHQTMQHQNHQVFNLQSTKQSQQFMTPAQPLQKRDQQQLLLDNQSVHNRMSNVSQQSIMSNRINKNSNSMSRIGIESAGKQHKNTNNGKNTPQMSTNYTQKSSGSNGLVNNKFIEHQSANNSMSNGYQNKFYKNGNNR
eukprot:403335301